MLLQSLLLILGLFLLSSQAGANTFKGNKRKQVSADVYPFRAVVRIHPTKENKSWCSGYLIGPRHVKTNVHCLKDENEVPFKQVYISIASDKYPGYDQPFLVKTRLNSNNFGKVDAIDDQYTLIMDQDIGNALGYFGVNINGNERSGRHGSLADIFSEKDAGDKFCGDSFTEPLDFIGYMFDKYGGKKFFYKNLEVVSEMKVCTASYPSDKNINKLTVEDTCGLAGFSDNAMVTNCSVTHGSSGGAFFYRKGDQYFAYGVISRLRTPKGEKDGENVTFGDSYYNLVTILEDEDLYLEAE